MEEILIEWAKNTPVIGVLLFAWMGERKERAQLAEYCRQRQAEYVNVILRLTGNGKDIDEIN